MNKIQIPYWHFEGRAKKVDRVRNWLAWYIAQIAIVEHKMLSYSLKFILYFRKVVVEIMSFVFPTQ